ncbi:hypothetical protein [Cellulomonas denverensis]|uniref:hypothetical protein n=1 Tax=Cellulomonas denverensis TaxID=264297 RepID=UPI0035E5952C
MPRGVRPRQPAGLGTSRRATLAVRDATRAASVHNSQPWRFVVAPGRVELHAAGGDRPRLIDPDDRWWLASLGAAAANLELGLRCRLRVPVTLAVDVSAAGSADPVLVATWSAARGIRPDTRPSTSDLRLHAAIPARRTARWPLYGPVGAAELDAVRAIVAAGPPAGVPEVRAHVAESATADLLALSAQVEDRLRDDPAYLAEVAGWAHRHDGRGIPGRAHGSADRSGRVPARDFSASPASPDGDRPRGDYEVQSTLIVLSTADDQPADRFAAGRALQRAALALTADGLGTGLAGQLVEDPDTRARARAAELLGIDGRTVQQVLRVGRPPADLVAGRSGRLPLRAVLRQAR